MTASVSEATRRQVILDLLNGKSEETIGKELSLDPAILKPLVNEVLQSDIFKIARSEMETTSRAGEVLKLIEYTRGLTQGIEKIPFCGAEDFQRNYLSVSRPVIFTDFSQGWPALQWTPETLASRFGDATIEITCNRDSEDRYDQNYKKLVKQTTLDNFVTSLLEAKSPTNDFYLIANNYALRDTELAALLDDVKLPEELFDTSVLKYRASLWMGPAGTLTTYHYDPGNIMFCQVYGKKRVFLLPPWEQQALQALKGYHLEEDQELDSEIEFELNAGESLFIPAGWFHKVESLTASISFSATCFKPQTSYMWYKPGFPVRGRT